MILSQTSFSKGLDLISPDTEIDQAGYAWIVNGRSRYGYVEPINDPLLIAGAPAGKKQGTIAIGNTVIIFVAGKAYFKRYDSIQWIEIPLFLMDDEVDLIYSQAVPASTRDYVRQLSTTGNINDPLYISNTSKSAGMPQGIVCQDGVSRPWILRFNEATSGVTARQLGTFDTWTQLNPEYVPIGKQMFILNQKLFIVAVEGNQVYHSVSGQTLNFMINIDKDGNKAASESLGGAKTTSFAFDYDQITCVQAVNVSDSFIYATKTTTRVITLNYLVTIFGEPIFSEATNINTGITNQYALADINGDYALVNGEGCRNFNAVQALKFEGRNSVFSKMVSKLFTGLRQDYAVAFSFDNYVMFNVLTVCGVLSVVYDSISGQWVALDKFDIGQILQVSIIDLPTELRVYAITSTSLYLLYSLTQDTATPFLATRAFSASGSNPYTNPPNTEGMITDIKSQKVDIIFRDGTDDGTVSCTEYCDGVARKTLTKPLVAASTVVPYELLPSIQPLIEPEGTRVTFNFSSTNAGFKLSYIITWDTDASLMKLHVVTTDMSKTTGNPQKARVLNG